MGFLDVVIALPFVWALYIGLKRGFVRQLATLGALILGVYGAVKFSSWLGEYFHQRFDVAQRLSQVVSFVVIFIGVLILVHVLGKMIQKALKAGGIGPVDRILGVLFAMAKTLIIVGVVLIFFDMVNRKIVMVSQEQTQKSLLYTPVIKLTATLFPALKIEYKQSGENTIAQ